MTWVKICGQTSPEGVRAAVAHGADALGFIFVEGVRRQRSPEQVAEWTADVSTSVAKVGVFMDQPAEQILAAARVAGLTALQLHGNEPPEMVAELQAAGYPVIKAVKLTSVADLAVLEHYVGADALLLEPHVAGEKGGAGIALDQSLAAHAVRHALRQATRPAAARHAGRLPPVILAGGLTPETVAAAVAATGAPAVDVSSGVETSGSKDPVRIATFIQAARGAHASGREA